MIKIKRICIVYKGTQYYRRSRFLVKYKSNNKENEFHYSNPESYLEDTPGIDEYENFMKILKYIEVNFNIKLD